MKYYCEFCNKEFTSIHGKVGHQTYCKSNPNKISSWNKGKKIKFEKTSCKFCNREISIITIKSHEDSCRSNPKNFRYCEECGNKIKSKDAKRFCDRSCAASFNNKKRGEHSINTRCNISNGIRKNLGIDDLKTVKDFLPKNCICGKEIKFNRKYCDECVDELIYKENLLSGAKASSLVFWGYEKYLSKDMSIIYGDVRKEIINDISFDFCNDKVIIEFTFSDSGITKAINRFEKIQKEKRKKIIYLPMNLLGSQRINKLNNLEVSILDCNLYNKYHPKNIK